MSLLSSESPSSAAHCLFQMLYWKWLRDVFVYICAFYMSLLKTMVMEMTRCLNYVSLTCALNKISDEWVELCKIAFEPSDTTLVFIHAQIHNLFNKYLLGNYCCQALGTCSSWDRHGPWPCGVHVQVCLKSSTRKELLYKKSIIFFLSLFEIVIK